MNTVKQPTIMPTNKLSASLIGMIVAAIAFEFLTRAVPTLRDVEIFGVGDLGYVAQLIGAGAAGWFTPDRPNVPN